MKSASVIFMSLTEAITRPKQIGTYICDCEEKWAHKGSTMIQAL